MANIPVFCDSCRIFYNSGIEITGSNITLYNNEVSCPKCGKMNYLPEGIFNIFKDSIQKISEANFSRVKLIEIKEKLEKISSNRNQETITEKIIEDNIPELNGILSFLPQKRSELYTFITLIITFLSFLIKNFENKNASQPQQINNYITKNYYTSPPKLEKKIYPNEKCYCNSGIKFKFCHGKQKK